MSFDSKISSKLRLWAKHFGVVPHPLDRRQAYTFLEPILKSSTGDKRINTEVLVKKGVNVLVGDGGSGKSTVARNLAYSCVHGYSPFKNKEGIPVFIRLNSEIANVGSVKELAKFVVDTLTDLNLSTDEVIKLFTDSNLYLVLDGLDEIFDKAKRQHFFDFANEELRARRVTLTSRANEIVNKLPHYTISGIDEEEVRDYITRKYNRLHGHVGDDLSKRFFEEIKRTPYIQPLIANPALLEQASIIFTSDFKFGETIYDFTSKMVDAFAFQYIRLGDSDSKNVFFHSSSPELQYGFRFLNDGIAKVGNWGTPIKHLFSRIAKRHLELQERSIPFEEYLEIIKDQFNTKSFGLSIKEEELIARSFLHFCPAFCEYEKDRFGFIHLYLKDIIGINAACSEHDPFPGFKKFIEGRDLTTQKRYFECMASKYAPEVSIKWFESCVQEGIINKENVTIFNEVVKQNNITLGAEALKKLEELTGVI